MAGRVADDALSWFGAESVGRGGWSSSSKSSSLDGVGRLSVCLPGAAVRMPSVSEVVTVVLTTGGSASTERRVCFSDESDTGLFAR